MFQDASLSFQGKIAAIFSSFCGFLHIHLAFLSFPLQINEFISRNS